MNRNKICKHYIDTIFLSDLIVIICLIATIKNDD